MRAQHAQKIVQRRPVKDDAVWGRMIAGTVMQMAREEAANENLVNVTWPSAKAL
ncbi:hypothetical protein NWI01_12130 [Nitrobacter winogradskyi]|uniref:Uncharacterized protein n=1 Tax=Nitrobacter winogradskyi TaxID=913 RepID=A0A4Y3WB18_NITWI|nr:hypothetical protein NWI01_12130 [Nitrobacter winogradskyi]